MAFTHKNVCKTESKKKKYMMSPGDCSFLEVHHCVKHYCSNSVNTLRIFSRVLINFRKQTSINNGYNQVAIGTAEKEPKNYK